MKHIVIPTRSFEDTLFTFRYAKMWFGDKDVKYHLLNAYSEPAKSSEIMVSLVDLMQKESIRHLERQQKEIISVFPDFKNHIALHSVYGDLPSAINHLNDSVPISMIAMATTGAGKIRRFFGGSHTANVVAKTKCPTLSIPYGYELNQIEEICFFVDYENIPNSLLLSEVKSLAQKKNCAIKAVHIHTDKKLDKEGTYESECKSAFQNAFAGLDYSLKSFYAPTVASGIQNYIAMENPSLVVMIAHKQNFLERMFNASDSKLITNVSDVPVLVFHD